MLEDRGAMVPAIAVAAERLALPLLADVHVDGRAPFLLVLLHHIGWEACYTILVLVPEEDHVAFAHVQPRVLPAPTDCRRQCQEDGRDCTFG